MPWYLSLALQPAFSNDHEDLNSISKFDSLNFYLTRKYTVQPKKLLSDRKIDV